MRLNILFLINWYLDHPNESFIGGKITKSNMLISVIGKLILRALLDTDLLCMSHIT